MELNKTYSGFTLNRIEHIDEINGTAYEMKHDKSGARLIYIDAPDTNKVFNIAFRTTPKDNTGVAHIMEHSVLCGSRKFPLKEPFVELVKGSLNTFLNAMTYPDKTMYPVASKNDKDFHNLMDVYLDAVFFPRVAEDPEIVMQEGWHYELETKEDPLTYKGVVFNEMKGVYSSPDSILERHSMEALFPDTTYGVDSGGDPDFITDLTYEKFQDFYWTYYHPSNAYIFLFGQMDIESHLAFIDEEYLSHFDAIDVTNTEIGLQASLVEGVQAAYSYSIGSEETKEGKTLHALTYVLNGMDQEKSLAFEVLTHALLTSPAAPLKQALIKAGVGSDISGYYLDSIRQPLWNIAVSGSNMGKEVDLKAIVDKTLAEIATNGLDKELLEASLNSIEFSLREADFGGRPIGLAYVIRMMDNWLYGKDPLELLHYEKALAAIRTGLEGTYFQDLVKESLLRNNHKALISIYPEPGLQEKKDKELTEKLAALKEAMSDQELEDIMAKTKHLKERQESPDSKEALASIPLLELSDLSPQVDKIERVDSQVGPTGFHFVPTFAKGINYVAYYFGLDCLTEEELFYADLLSDMLGRVNAGDKAYDQVAKDINLNLGGFSTDIIGIGKNRSRHDYRPFFVIRAKALHSKLPELVRIVDYIIKESHYTDQGRLEEIVNENKAIWDNEAFRRGHTLVSQRLMAQFSELGKFKDAGNLSLYQNLQTLVKDPKKMADLPLNLSKVAKKIFRSNNLHVLLVGQEGEDKAFLSLAQDSLASLPQEELPTGQLNFSKEVKREGIYTAGKVQYVAQGGNFLDHGHAYVGAMSVLETILRYEYLWIKVRVQGGAYGAFANFYDNGNMVLCSYRDPNLVETLDAYKELADYLDGFSINDREMRKYIIGTMSGLDLPMTPSLMGPRAMSDYFSGLSHQAKVDFRQEVIDCRPEDIKGLAQVVRDVMNDQHVCTMGNEQKIKEADYLFDRIISLS